MNREDDLHKLLEEAERRREEDLKRMGRVPSLLIAIPLSGLLLAAGVFLLRYQAEDTPPTAKPEITAEGSDQLPDKSDTGELSSFIPESLGGKPSAKGAESNSGIVTQEDIRFAMELLNYCRPPSAWKDEKK